jgi:hypothetical protein
MPKSIKYNESDLLKACEAAPAEKKNQISPRLRVNMALRLQHYVTAINMAGSLVQLRNQLIKHLRGIRRKDSVTG